METTYIVLLASLLTFPLWLLLETLVQGTVHRCMSQDGAEVPIKMSHAVTTSVSHSIQLVMWWVLVLSCGYSTWVFDVKGWAEIMLPRPWDTHELDEMAPYWAVYFGFAWHSLVKDLRRSWGNLNSPDQLSFLLHHILTVGLVAGAIKVGCWRCGVLTRLIHDPADIFLYGSKFYQGLCDQGRGSWNVLTVLYLLNNVVWSVTRVFVYGYLVYTLRDVLILIFADDKYDTVTRGVASTLAGASLMMWVLQVIWFIALVAATKKFLATKADGKLEQYIREHKDLMDVGQPDKKGVPLLPNGSTSGSAAA